jgi:hypothetical protein
MGRVPSRYPNGLTDDVVPADFFDRSDSERALAAARTILEAVGRHSRRRSPRSPEGAGRARAPAASPPARSPRRERSGRFDGAGAAP